MEGDTLHCSAVPLISLSLGLSDGSRERSPPLRPLPSVKPIRQNFREGSETLKAPLSVFTCKDLGRVGTEIQENLDSCPLLYPEGP